jgi:hypothetical protein
MDRTTPTAEINSVYAAISYLVNKLTTLKQFLPPPNRKRGLIDLGGSVLKAQFGTATVRDMNTLHHTLNQLHKWQEEVAHSVEQQVTYFTRLNKDVQFNYMAISNLSTTLRNLISRTEETFQEVSSKFEWASRQRLVTTIRDLRVFDYTARRAYRRMATGIAVYYVRKGTH